jgi:predicted nucleic acid-binding protein
VSSNLAVVNASPIISLCKSDQEDLLPKLFNEITVPGAVWDEIVAGGASDPAANKMVAAKWLKRDDTVPIASIIQAWDLGPEVLANKSTQHPP